MLFSSTSKMEFFLQGIQYIKVLSMKRGLEYCSFSTNLTEYREISVHPNLFLHGDSKQNDKIHDKNRPKDRDVEEIEKCAEMANKNRSECAEPRKHRYIYIYIDLYIGIFKPTKPMPCFHC